VDIKRDLTKQFADHAGIVADSPKLIDNLYKMWWQNLRGDGNRSFGLTPEGYRIASDYLKFYQIDLPVTLIVTNQTVIWMDRYLDCPYYTDGRSLYVSREKVAVQLILFSGDINRYGKAKNNNRNAETANPT
jgi:hypothetical protein